MNFWLFSLLILAYRIIAPISSSIAWSAPFAAARLEKISAAEVFDLIFVNGVSVRESKLAEEQIAVWNNDFLVVFRLPDSRFSHICRNLGRRLYAVNLRQLLVVRLTL